MKRSPLQNPRVDVIHLKSTKNLFDICHAAKNLYNATNYIIKSIKHNKLNYIPDYKDLATNYNNHQFVNKDNLIKRMRELRHENYYALPNQSSSLLIDQVFKEWSSYFCALREYKIDKSKFQKPPREPGFKDKKNGQYNLTFYKGALGLKEINNEKHIFFPKMSKFNLPELDPVKTRLPLDKIQQVKIVPTKTDYKLIIVYEKDKQEWYWCDTHNVAFSASRKSWLLEKKWKKGGTDPSQVICRKFKPDKNNTIAMDPGMNCLFAIANNFGKQFVLINGRPLKAINQYSNKQLSKAMGYIGSKGKSKRTMRITNKRNKKMQHSIHLISSWLRQYCIKHNVGTVIIGKNNGWKQEVKLGWKKGKERKKLNQNFVTIPFAKLIDMIIYKLEELGIEVILTEESYTSKTDHFALENMSHRDTGYIKEEGKFVFSSVVGKIHRDINGAIGIGRKVKGDDFVKSLTNRGTLGLVPVKLNPLEHNYLDMV